MHDRFKVLLTSGIAIFSFYYAYDIFGVLSHGLDFGGYGNKETRINLLYSAYAVPNIIFPPFFSYFARFSRFGVLLCLSMLVLAGQVLSTLGILYESFAAMMVGRAFFGMGCESYSVIQNEIITEHFKQSELLTAMSLYNACGRMGMMVSFLLAPQIPRHSNAAAACIIILAGTAIQLWYQTHTDSRRALEKGLVPGHSPAEAPGTADLGGTGAMIQSPAEMLNVLIEHPQSYLSSAVDGTQSAAGFHPSFKVLVAICFLFGMVWAPFYNIAPMVYQRRFGISKPGSSRMLGCIEGISMVLVLVVCPLVDRHGYKLVMVLAGSIVLAFAHLAILVPHAHPLYSVVLLGIACPLISCYWPCLPSLVSGSCLSLGFAILYCASNLALTVSPIIIAYLALKDPSYSYLESYALVLTACMLLSTSLLIYQDSRRGLRLNRSEMLRRHPSV